MKKFYILPALALCFLSLVGKSQIPNYGFENLDTNGMIRNWTNTTLFQVSIDSNGNADSLVIDQGLYFSTTDAHSGQYAMEMRNAYNFTLGIGFAGSAQASPNDTEYAFFDTFLPMLATPSSFSFFCKYLPVAGESAVGSMDIYDSSDVLLGNATVVVAGTVSNWTSVSAPVIYTTAGSPAFMTISFRTCAPNQNPGFGTRFVVDDLSMAISATGVAQVAHTEDLIMNCYPSKVDDNLNLTFTGTGADKTAMIHIVDAGGRVVQSQMVSVDTGKPVIINTSLLASGAYFVRAVAEGRLLHGRFIK